jgi:hypothetical protein
MKVKLLLKQISTATKKDGKGSRSFHYKQSSILVRSSCPRQTGAGRQKGEPTPETPRLYIDRALRYCFCFWVLQVSALSATRTLAATELSPPPPRSPSLKRASSPPPPPHSHFFNSRHLSPAAASWGKYSFSTLVLKCCTRVLLSSTASRALISLCTPPSHSLCVSFSLSRFIFSV